MGLRPFLLPKMGKKKIVTPKEVSAGKARRGVFVPPEKVFGFQGAEP